MNLNIDEAFRVSRTSLDSMPSAVDRGTAALAIVHAYETLASKIREAYREPIAESQDPEYVAKVRAAVEDTRTVSCPSNECAIREACTGHAGCTGERTAASKIRAAIAATRAKGPTPMQAVVQVTVEYTPGTAEGDAVACLRSIMDDESGLTCDRIAAAGAILRNAIKVP